MSSTPAQAENLRQHVKRAVELARSELRWKPGKAQEHLAKRIERGHLPTIATLTDYQVIIREVVSSSTAQVHVYRFAGADYITLVADHAGRRWLVMFSPDGILETAFPPDDPDAYFRDEPRFIAIGSVEEVMA